MHQPIHLLHLIIRNAKLLAEIQVDVQVVSISHSLPVHLDSSVFDISGETWTMEAVEELGLTFSKLIFCLLSVNT